MDENITLHVIISDKKPDRFSEPLVVDKLPAEISIVMDEKPDRLTEWISFGCQAWLILIILVSLVWLFGFYTY